MNSTAKLLTRSAMAVAAISLVVATGAAPAAAQAERCPDLYNRVMALYQAAPYSAEYSRISAYYVGRCLNSSSMNPADAAPYQTAPEPQPVAIFPGEIIVGGPPQYDESDRSDGDRGFR